MKIIWSLVLAVVAGGLWSATPAAAQPLGSFRWQLQPYCNVLTLAVVQQGGQYQLDGIDDQCVAAQAASVRGMAFLNPNGSIGFGLTVVTAPGGTPIHIDATISLPGLNGTWRDSAGNTGNLIFGAGVPSSGPRPVPTGGLPPASVTTIQIAAAAVTAAQLANGAVTSASIANGTVTTADLAAPPLLQGNTDLLVQIPLTTAYTVIRTVTLQIPANGTVLANSDGIFRLNGATVDGAVCSITQSTAVISLSQLSQVEEVTAAAIRYVPFGGTRMFAVTPGTFTVNLVCQGYLGITSVFSPNLNALFIPG
jgi:hypothetical protein